MKKEPSKRQLATTPKVVKSKNLFMSIQDDRTYTHEQIAAILGRADRWVKEFVRQNVEHADFGNGLLLVSGRMFRAAVERLSQAGRLKEESGD